MHVVITATESGRLILPLSWKQPCDSHPDTDIRSEINSAQSTEQELLVASPFALPIHVVGSLHHQLLPKDTVTEEPREEGRVLTNPRVSGEAPVHSREGKTSSVCLGRQGRAYGALHAAPVGIREVRRLQSQPVGIRQVARQVQHGDVPILAALGLWTNRRTDRKEEAMVHVSLFSKSIDRSVITIAAMHVGGLRKRQGRLAKESKSRRVRVRVRVRRSFLP